MPDEKLSPILFLGTQMAVGGSQHVLLTLARWFHQHGYRVVAAFIYDRDGLYQQWRSNEPFTVINLDAKQAKSGILSFYGFLQSIIRLYRLMIGERFAVVTTFTHHSNLVGIPLAWLAGVPVRVAAHRGRIEKFPPGLERLHGLMINSVMTNCLVTNSQHVRDQAIELEGVKSEKIVVIPNGIGSEFCLTAKNTLFNGVSAIVARQKTREVLGISLQAQLLLSVGRLTDQKGHIYLVDAMPYVLSHFPDALVLLAGDGSTRQGLEERVRELGIGGAVRFLGTRSDIPALLAAADLFVLPSISEGMPNALLEAMGMGVPVVAFFLGCVEEIVTHGETGYLVFPGDARALGEAIVSLLENLDLRMRLGKAGRELVEKKYTLEQMCESYERIFKQFKQ
ncbi:MAG: glycosyltransferase family 4 protein [Anaerolineales bacterium]|nr:glycosyltransferase family 4 protein [Anaerolineales bacterium]